MSPERMVQMPLVDRELSKVRASFSVGMPALSSGAPPKDCLFLVLWRLQVKQPDEDEILQVRACAAKVYSRYDDHQRYSKDSMIREVTCLPAICLLNAMLETVIE